MSAPSIVQRCPMQRMGGILFVFSADSPGFVPGLQDSTFYLLWSVVGKRFVYSAAEGVL